MKLFNGLDLWANSDPLHLAHVNNLLAFDETPHALLYTETSMQQNALKSHSLRPNRDG